MTLYERAGLDLIKQLGRSNETRSRDPALTRSDWIDPARGCPKIPFESTARAPILSFGLCTSDLALGDEHSAIHTRPLQEPRQGNRTISLSVSRRHPFHNLHVLIHPPVLPLCSHQRIKSVPGTRPISIHLDHLEVA